MRKFFKNITADKLTYRGFIISFLTLILSIGFILIFYQKLPPYIPIFNQLPWGEARITTTPGIFIPIIIYFVIFIINIIFTSVVYLKNPLIARIVAATTLLIAILNFIFIIRTILVLI